MSNSECGFKRARRPEQVEERKRAIVDAAAQMLAQAPVADISLRELSSRIGLSKSNVLRYFETREAIFLDILEREQDVALADIAARLAELPPEGERRAELVADAVADALIARPLMCELVSTMASVLERNISIEFARGFKLRASQKVQDLANLVRGAVPELCEQDAAHFAGITYVLVAGLWPHARPTDVICTVMSEMGLQSPPEIFASYLRDGLTVQLIGLLARAKSPIAW